MGYSSCVKHFQCMQMPWVQNFTIFHYRTTKTQTLKMDENTISHFRLSYADIRYEQMFVFLPYNI